jgi:TolA-binding protein
VNRWTNYLPILSVALIVLAFFAGRLSGGSRGASGGEYYLTSAKLYDDAVKLDTPPADAKDMARWEKVLSAYRRVFDNYPDSPYADDALFAIASRIDIQEQPDTAFALYRRLIRNYPDSDHAPEALNAIGVALFQREQYERALVLFDELIKNYPNSPLIEKASLNHAICQYKRAKFDEALQELLAFSERFPASDQIAAPIFYAGMIQYDKQLYDEARARFQNIVDLGDKEYAAAAQFNIGQTFFDERKYPEAIAAYRRTIEAFKDSEFASEASFRIGWALERQRKYNDAIKELKGAIEKYPTSKNAPAAQIFIAQIYAEGLKDIPKAVEAFRAIVDNKVNVEAIQTDARSAYDIRRDAQYQIGRLYETSGQKDLAIKEYERLLKDFAEPHSNPRHKSNEIDEAYILDLKAKKSSA